MKFIVGTILIFQSLTLPLPAFATGPFPVLADTGSRGYANVPREEIEARAKNLFIRAAKNALEYQNGLRNSLGKHTCHEEAGESVSNNYNLSFYVCEHEDLMRFPTIYDPKDIVISFRENPLAYLAAPLSILGLTNSSNFELNIDLLHHRHGFQYSFACNIEVERDEGWEEKVWLPANGIRHSISKYFYKYTLTLSSCLLTKKFTGEKTEINSISESWMRSQPYPILGETADGAEGVYQGEIHLEAMNERSPDLPIKTKAH